MTSRNRTGVDTRRQVRSPSERRDTQHERSINLRWCQKPAHSLDDHANGQRQKNEPVRVRGESLVAPVSVGPVRTCRPPAHPNRDHRENERPAVREHVRRFREQRKGVCPEAANGLDGSKRREYRESYAKTPFTGFAAVVMVMVMVMGALVCMVVRMTTLVGMMAMPRVMVMVRVFAVRAHRRFLLLNGAASLRRNAGP